MWVHYLISLIPIIGLVIGFVNYVKKQAAWCERINIRLEQMCISCPMTCKSIETMSEEVDRLRNWRHEEVNRKHAQALRDELR